MFVHNGLGFSTFDNDNDECGCNCAALYHGGGGNWWGSCGRQNINGKYGGDGDSGDEFMFWFGFDNSEMLLETMTLMFRQVD